MYNEHDSILYVSVKFKGENFEDWSYAKIGPRPDKHSSQRPLVAILRAPQPFELCILIIGSESA